MAQLQKGTTYITGDQVTAANLNALVDSGILTPGAVTDQTAKTVPLAADTILLHSAADTALRKTTMTQLFATPQPLGATTPSSVAATTGTFSSTLGVTGVATLGNGAILGTPASGTVTNLTGTASININGTVGATTPSTVAGTTGIFSSYLGVGTSLGSAGFFRFNDATVAGYFGFFSGGALYSGTTTNHPTAFLINNLEVGRLTSTGLNSTAIGATTPSTGAFSTLSATGLYTSSVGNNLPFITANGASTGWSAIRIDNTGGSTYIGSESSVGGTLVGGSTAYDALIRTHTGLSISTNSGSGTQLRISSAGAAITGTLSATGTITANADMGQQSSTVVPVFTVANTIGGPSKRTTFTQNTDGSYVVNNDVASNGSAPGYVVQVNGTERTRVSTTGLAVTGTLSATGQIQAPYGSFTTQAIRVGDSSYGAYVDSGYLYFKNSNSGSYRFRNTANTGDYVAVDSTGLAVTGTLSASTRGYFGGATGADIGSIESIFSAASIYGISLKDSSDTSGAGFVIFRKANQGEIGNISRVSTTNAVVYNTTSDARLKENLRDFTDSGRLIDALKPRVFDWKGDTDGNGKNVIGFVAQEEHAADPIFAHIGAVSVGDDNPTTITKQWQRSDAALIPILVAELQSLRKRLAVLESK